MKENALLLLSGGIDSPVAGKVALDKFNIVGVHFSQVPFTDDTPEKKSLACAKVLGLDEMIVVDAGQEFKKIAENSKREYYFVLIKRFMMKVSEKLAEQRSCKFLITGESLGQVSSQTLSNLNSINQGTTIEILRPLLFLEKQEIIDLSIKENLFEISTGPEVCDALAVGKPKTKTKIEDVLREEESCEMQSLVNKAVKNVRIVKVE